MRRPTRLSGRKVALALIVLECLEFIELPFFFALCVSIAVAADP